MIAIDIQSGVGMGLALLAALFAATYQLLVRLSTDDGNTNDALVVILIVNSLILLPIAVARHGGALLQPVPILYFVAAGLSGSMAGRAFNYMGIERIGASRASPITSSNALIATFLGIVLLGEAYTLLHLVGVVFIVVGVGYISYETSRHNPGNVTQEDAFRGLIFALLALVFYGLEPIFAKAGLNTGMPFVSGLAIKVVAAVIGFLAYLRIWKSTPRLTFTDPNMRLYLLAGGANTLFMLSYYAALQTAPVVFVYPIVTSYTLFVIVLSFLFMPERLEKITLGLIAGALVTVVGIVLVGIGPT